MPQSIERAGPSCPSSIVPADVSSCFFQFQKVYGATEDGTPFEWTNEDVGPFDETSPAAAHLIASRLSGFRCFCVLSQAWAWLLFHAVLSFHPRRNPPNKFLQNMSRVSDTKAAHLAHVVCQILPCLVAHWLSLQNVVRNVCHSWLHPRSNRPLYILCQTTLLNYLFPAVMRKCCHKCC